MSDTVGTFYIVSTPLGNLGDLSRRAIEVLSSVEKIAAEDTRHTGALLRHFAIKTPCISCHDHNETDRIEQLLGYLRRGESIALVSDAGTPLISDPGFKLVRALAKESITIVPVPGPCAVTTALVACGLPTDRFSFFGFLPAKQGGRVKWLEAMSNWVGTAVFYESKHRLIQSLQDMLKVFGDVDACVGRELTKEYESFYRGTLSEVSEQLSNLPSLLGEFVVLVHLLPQEQAQTVSLTAIELQQLLQQGPSKKQLASFLAERTSRSKQEWYKELVEQSHHTQNM